MTGYLLDTSVLIDVLRHGSHSSAASPMQTHEGSLVTSMLAAEELYRGAWRSRQPAANLLAVDELLDAVTPLEFGRVDASRAGRIDAELSRAGLRIGPFDTLIAAQALVRDMTLVTRNLGEFERVAGLAVVRW